MVYGVFVPLALPPQSGIPLEPLIILLVNVTV